MFWLLYLALPVYAGEQVASHVAPKHGLLAGLSVLIAVMLAVLVPQTAFLLWLSAVVDRPSKANPEKGPARTTVESANVPMPEKTGARARFRQLIVYQIELNQVLSDYNREQQGNLVSDYFALCILKDYGAVIHAGNVGTPNQLRQVLDPLLKDPDNASNLPK